MSRKVRNMTLIDPHRLWYMDVHKYNSTINTLKILIRDMSPKLI